MIDAMMGIAVFTDDRALLNHAEEMWRKRVPSYFYNAKLDGRSSQRSQFPFTREGWFGQTTFDETTNGVAAGDLPRPWAYGLCPLRYYGRRGDGTYSGRQVSLKTKNHVSWHAGVSRALALEERSGARWLCAAARSVGGEGYTFGIGYNEFHNRLGQSLPETREWLDRVLTIPEPVDMHSTVFELLTHGEDAGGVSR